MTMNVKEFLNKIHNDKKNDSFYTVFNQFVFYLFASGKENYLGEKVEVNEFNNFVCDFEKYHDALLKYYVQVFHSDNIDDRYIDAENEIKELVKVNHRFIALKDRKINDFKNLFNEKIIENKIRITANNNKNIRDSYINFSKLKEDYDIIFKKQWDNISNEKLHKIVTDKCHYCNISISEIERLSENLELLTKRTYYGRGFTLEIDRKNPYGQYLPNNVVLSCYWCNNAKTDEFNETEFKSIGQTIEEVWKSRLKKIGETKNICISKLYYRFR